MWCKHETKSYGQSLTTDLHTPSRNRVRGMLVNNDDFRKAFSCPEEVGDHYHEWEKCDLW